MILYLLDYFIFTRFLLIGIFKTPEFIYLYFKMFPKYLKFYYSKALSTIRQMEVLVSECDAAFTMLRILDNVKNAELKRYQLHRMFLLALRVWIYF